MHMLASAAERFTCISVVHEVAAGIATEYFNEISATGKAFALVTAGPGLTNIVTALAGAYLESRELLVIGGQVKTSDLARGFVRQRGIQEVAGVAIAAPVAKNAVLIDDAMQKDEVMALIHDGRMPRKGPIFLEIPLDVQGRTILDISVLAREPKRRPVGGNEPMDDLVTDVVERMVAAQRPVFLLGGGVERTVARDMRDHWADMGVPIMTTWNGADRIPAEHPLYFGRPNTWGQRYSNVLIQQSDCVVAFGTRLGLQQTGFNYREFVPGGAIVQIDCDARELNKGHPHVELQVKADANIVLRQMRNYKFGNYAEWRTFCSQVKAELPVIETCNATSKNYISPHKFVKTLSEISRENDIIIPCSSGGAFTVMMQVFEQKDGQIIVTNKGLASMGYGLSGAIGAALADRSRRVLLVEGDGGFAQNMQELGTLERNNLNVKVFIFDDGGYASIRMTQRNYFGGRYVGCDRSSGLGLPDWELLFRAFGIRVQRLHPDFLQDEKFLGAMEEDGPVGFVVPIDPEQTYFPKIGSRVTESGSMESNALDVMDPRLEPSVDRRVRKYRD